MWCGVVWCGVVWCGVVWLDGQMSIDCLPQLTCLLWIVELVQAQFGHSVPVPFLTLLLPPPALLQAPQGLLGLP